jgi:acetolactate synthase I/II/III large subunit
VSRALNAGELIARSLAAHGVTHLFGLGGGHIDTVWSAAPKVGIRVVDVRHEAAAAYAAEGWALATGQLGVCMVTAGPGLTNALTGLATAHANGSPMLCIAGAATSRGRDVGEVEALDQLALAAPVTKWARAIQHVEQLGDYVATAFSHAVTGRPGPVYLEVPIDLVHSSAGPEDAPLPSPAQAWVEQRRLMAPGNLVREAAVMLGRAQRPALLAGSGVFWSDAGTQLQEFVEHTSIPVVTRQQGRGTISDDHPLCFGRDWQNVVARADVLLVVGTQLGYFVGYGHYPHLEQLIQVDIDPTNLTKATLGIVGDAGAVLDQLVHETGRLDTENWVSDLRKRAEAIAASKAAMGRSETVPIHPLRLCAEIASQLEPDATVITDGSNMLMWTNVAFDARLPGRQPSMAPLGNIGHGVGYALAAACARPGSQVLWVVGDGSFGFHAMELDTAARHHLPIVTVIVNNGGWSAGWVPLKERHYERMAGAFDGFGALVEKPEQIADALSRAFEHGRSGAPSILNVLVDPAPEYFPGRFLE